MSKKVAQSHAFSIDCSKPVEDKVFNTANFTEFLRQRIKIQGFFYVLFVLKFFFILILNSK
jgi:hypothetical protein